MADTDPGLGSDPSLDVAEFEAPVRIDAGVDVDGLTVDVEGFEGPLDLLLSLARTQKVDLKKISILALADQYLQFIAEARRMRLELAADYLVMAAWLAYLKSRLILPEPEGDEEPTGEELAARLALQLRRLEAIRTVAARLMGRDRLGRDLFARGMPEGVRVVRTPKYEVSLFELLKAYADERVRHSVTSIRIVRAPVFRIEEARARLEAILGAVKDWSRLERLLPPELRVSELGRSALASTLVASLEMCREGQVVLRQLVPFGPVYIRAKGENEDDAYLSEPPTEAPAPLPESAEAWGLAVASAFEKSESPTEATRFTPGALLEALEAFTREEADVDAPPTDTDPEATS